MTANNNEAEDTESSEVGSGTDEDVHYDAGDARQDDVGGGRGGFELTRRNALLTGLIGGLGLFGSQTASADHPDPLTKWNRDQTAQNEYTLIELAGLNMAVMPHDQNLEDFEGSGLKIEEEDNLNKLTVNFSEDRLARRYLAWNNDDKKLDFTGAAEWENEVDDFSESGSPNSASGTASVTGGGDSNTANGDYSTIPGGQNNNAGGSHSFAAGEGANADHEGSFVWATGGDSSRGEDSVLFQASGGAYLAEGNLDIEDGNFGAENSITARTGNVTADAGDVIADQNVTARNGDVSADSGSVTANDDVTADTGDVTATNGNVEGYDLIARNKVDTEIVESTADLTLDAPGSNDVISETDLTVNGDLHVTGTKHFVTAVETPSGPKQVAYTSVEAGKPRTEAADVADLTDGRAEIDLPDHFAMVTSEDAPLTVQVTPYASERVHPQVVDRSLERIVIEDMGDGPDDYRVAYTVSGVREGYENESAIREQ